MQKRYVKLNASEREALLRLHKDSPLHRVRNRAHALLLSDEGNDANSLCSIFNVRLPAVYSWMNRWEERGIEGLYDLPGRGRKRLLSPEEEKK